MMAFSMAGIALMSEFLVGSVETATTVLGLTPFFVGIIIAPLSAMLPSIWFRPGCPAEQDGPIPLYRLGVQPADRTLRDTVLVFVSLIMGNPLTLEFNQLELIALAAATFISAWLPGWESNWLEGAMLLAVYGILSLAFFFLPAKVL